MARRSQEQRRASTRGQLIAAAADLFARKGFHAVSAEAVADAADRTTGALYDHFGGKEGLLLALLDVWKEQAAEEVSAALESISDLDGRTAALWTAITGPGSARGDAWLLLEVELWLHGARDPVLGEPLAERYARIRRQLGEGLADWAREAGGALRRPPEEAAALVLAVLLGAALQHRLDPPAVQQRVVLAGLRDLLGCRPTGRASPGKGEDDG